MAVIALCSASGSPGVTTTALGLALAWPRPVMLVEADPVGGSAILAGWFQGARDHDAGLLDVAFAAEPVDQALSRVAVGLSDTVRFVPGARSHIEARELHGLWPALMDALTGLDASGQDAIVDAGRLEMAASPHLVLERAASTLLVTRTDLPALAATRSHADLVARTRPWRQAGLLAVGSRSPYPAREAAKLLGLPLVASIAFDPHDAAVYHRGATPRTGFFRRPFARRAFARSVHAAAQALYASVTTGAPPSTSEPPSAEVPGEASGRVPDRAAAWTAAAADQRRERA